MTAILSSETMVRLLASILCISLAIIALLVRSSTRERHNVRMRRLDQSRDLMTFHSRNLEVFLADPTSPNPLKRVAIEFASLMQDRNSVCNLASWLCSQPLGTSVSDVETLEIVRELNRLNYENPILGRAFSSALVCGVLGAILRWPESARLFELAGPTMISDGGEREVAAAIRATKMRTEPALDMDLSYSPPRMVAA